MKRALIFGAIFLCLGLSSCRCADPPPVGPTEDEEEQAHVAPASEVSGDMVRLG